ncbi:MAG: cysteine desulfurase [Candidatus Wildermuthbacteria bacterium]|nr:cysteine desulfurase [Candidatus Wildermuthbacteria bacterium]
MRKRIYLDYSASTPVDPKVLRAMLPYFKKEFGNPSSRHGYGQRASAAIEHARTQVANFLGCAAQEIIFTGGATESNNLAIQGIVGQKRATKPHVITSAIEHESVLEVCRTLEKEGAAEVSYLTPDAEGIIEVKEVERAIRPNTTLVSIGYANSVIGTIQPIAEIGKLLSQYNIQNTTYKILFHTDAVQAALYLSCDVKKLGVDLLTLSAHKLYGPKGVGALFVKTGVALRPLLFGGGQENDQRAGTQNVPGIVGLGTAIQELQNPRMALTAIKIRQLRDRLTKTILKKISGAALSGSSQKRLPSNVHIRFEGCQARDIAFLFDQKGIAVSTGSACSERSQEPCHVLLAMGFSAGEALSGVRITLGRYTTAEEIDAVAEKLPAIITQLRKS